MIIREVSDIVRPGTRRRKTLNQCIRNEKLMAGSNFERKESFNGRGKPRIMLLDNMTSSQTNEIIKCRNICRYIMLENIGGLEPII